MKAPRPGLGVKLAIAMVASLTVLLTVMGVFYVRQCRLAQELLIQQSEDRLGEVIRRSTRTAMLRNDRDELASMLPEIGRMQSLQRVRIYDKGGEIRYSSRLSEVGQRVDLSADACDRCHASEAPLTHLERQDRVRIYRVDGKRVMGTIHPIPNEPECADASCHVHPREQGVLGVLDVQMSLAQIDALMQKRSRLLAVASLGFLAVVSILSVSWALRSVHRPVQHLLRATRAISAGDLEQRVPEQLDSDLSELVQSFNQMTADLKEARAESDGWARSLELRVEEKSAALRRAQDDMVQIEKMVSLGKLAAIVAHEINNPLAGIRTYARLILKRMGSTPSTERLQPKETQEWVARIESEAARCGDIVRNLLSFARDSQPKIEASDLNEIIAQSLRLVQHQLDLASVAVTTDLRPGLPAVECDPQQIKQALLAMFINASEAMPQGGTLQVASNWAGDSPPAAAGGLIAITIRDSGVGMDAETRKHIFEPFFTTKDGSASGGTGLGLAVTYGIIKSHGGRIRVESAPGSGTLFVLELPLRHQEERPQGDQA